METKEKTKEYLVRMTPTLRRQIGEVAEETGTSFASYVRQLIVKDVKRFKKERDGE